MLYAPTQDQQEFRQAVRSFLERRAPERGLLGRIEEEDRFDRALWRDMAEQLGLQGLTIPEQHGGSEFGPIELALVLEEHGRALTPVPYFGGAALAVPLILASGDATAQAEHLPAIAAGETIVAAALAEPGSRTGDAPSAMRADASGSLSGVKTYVADGDLADLFVVSADTADGATLFLVAADAPGVSVRRLTTLDPTRPQAELTLDGAPGTRLGEAGAAGPLVADVLQRATVLLAAEQVGLAERCLEIMVAYAKDRVQFGVPIGSFQAVKHLCANVLCEVERARAAAWYAAWAAADAPEELATVAPAAKHICSQAAVTAAETCIHVLGGIGFTWEHPAHLFFKRAVSSAQFVTSQDETLQRLADELLRADEGAQS